MRSSSVVSSALESSRASTRYVASREAPRNASGLSGADYSGARGVIVTAKRHSDAMLNPPDSHDAAIAASTSGQRTIRTDQYGSRDTERMRGGPTQPSISGKLPAFAEIEATTRSASGIMASDSQTFHSNPDQVSGSARIAGSGDGGSSSSGAFVRSHVRLPGNRDGNERVPFSSHTQDGRVQNGATQSSSVPTPFYADPTAPSMNGTLHPPFGLTPVTTTVGQPPAPLGRHSFESAGGSPSSSQDYPLHQSTPGAFVGGSGARSTVPFGPQSAAASRTRSTSLDAVPSRGLPFLGSLPLPSENGLQRRQRDFSSGDVFSQQRDRPHLRADRRPAAARASPERDPRTSAYDGAQTRDVEMTPVLGAVPIAPRGAPGIAPPDRSMDSVLRSEGESTSGESGAKPGGQDGSIGPQPGTSSAEGSAVDYAGPSGVGANLSASNSLQARDQATAPSPSLHHAKSVSSQRQSALSTRTVRPKKMLHREVEQARRSRMTAQIELLRAQLAPSRPKTDKVSVLQAAVAFIAEANSRIATLEAELSSAREEANGLRRQLHDAGPHNSRSQSPKPASRSVEPDERDMRTRNVGQSWVPSSSAGDTNSSPPVGAQATSIGGVGHQQGNKDSGRDMDDKRSDSEEEDSDRCGNLER